MKIAYLTSKGFVVREQAMPVCGPNQVLVKNISCGVCEGDLQHYLRVQGTDVAEGVIGHEASGTVAAVGADVSEFRVGQAVTALGGPYAEYWLANPTDLVVLPEGVDPRWALGEPVSCFVHAGNRFGVKPGDKVAIVGCGFMGLGSMQIARIQGAKFICGLDPIGWRREFTRDVLGADAVHSPTEMTGEQLVKKYGDFDVVIEAAGVQAAVDISGELVKQHGRIVFVGYHQSGGGLRTVNMKMWNYKAIDVVNGHVRRINEKLAAMRQGLELMAAGKLKIQPLVTYYPLADIEQAFQDLAARKEGLFKAALVP